MSTTFFLNSVSSDYSQLILPSWNRASRMGRARRRAPRTTPAIRAVVLEPATNQVLPLTAPRRGGGWAVLITGLALFMASLDNLVVTTALPVIRVRLHAGLSGLEWTVNAYTLTFAVLLLTAAAFGERFGRRRMFTIGIVVFTLASGAAAMR
jgi:hypothetical protein